MNAQARGAMTRKLRQVLQEQGLKAAAIESAVQALGNGKPKALKLPKDISKRICNIILEGERAVVIKSPRTEKWKVYRLEAYLSSRAATKAAKPWEKTRWHKRRTKAAKERLSPPPAVQVRGEAQGVAA